MSSHLVALRLGLLNLLSHIRLALAMSLVITVSVTMFILMVAYRTGMADGYTHLIPNLLVVQESQSFGEMYGSRLSPQVGRQLTEMGISMVAPEIDVLTGTSVKNITWLRGVDLDLYDRLEPITILSGRKLQSDDPPRLAMVGSIMASAQNVKTGMVISLRGRNFTVIGIFHTGTYADKGAWISLADAQALLDWGQDVSVYIIPDEGILHDGQVLPKGISIVRKGESGLFFANQYKPVLDLMSIVVVAIGVATALALTNILWRLAWLRKRDIAILRATGFPTLSMASYLLAQALGVTLAGILLGGLAALTITSIVHITAPNFSIRPRLDIQVALSSLGWIGLMVLSGCLLPAWWLSHLNLAQLLHSE